MTTNQQEKNKIISISKLSNSKIAGDSSVSIEAYRVEPENVSQWTTNMVKIWLCNLGLLPVQIKNALKYLKTGKCLINLSDSEIESYFLITNDLHKRKLKLAIENLKHPEKWLFNKILFNLIKNFYLLFL